MSEGKKQSDASPKPAAKDTAPSPSKPAAKDTAPSPSKPAQAKEPPSEQASAKAEAAAKAAEEAAAVAREALAKAEAAKAEAEAAAEAEYKAIAAEVKAEAAKAPDYTFKRQGEEIFRREMGEPEFWLDKKDRFPRPILTQDQQESLTRKAEIPHDQTPVYNPQHVLSPEFGGVSNYERGVDSFLDDARQTLENLKADPESTRKEIKTAQDRVAYLESLHENYYIGMNVFRTAKGGRDRIKA